MFGFKTKEAFLSNNVRLYGEVACVLEKEGISFRTKTVNNGNRSRRTGSVIGGFGEDPTLETMYYIYVSEADLSRAKHLINEWNRSRNH